MYVPSANNLAAADTFWPRERVSAACSRRSKRKFWRKFVMSLVAIPDGVLLVDKAEGMTSHDVVAIARRQLGIKKIGHCGTLPLGSATSTQDREGEVVETRPVPDLSESEIRAAFEKFRGDFYQMPPMVSAKKHGGVPLYKLARQGKVVEREPRFVHVYRFTIDRIELPEIDFSVLCSKGFYVRTYAHDIGQLLGCGAHLKSLRRTQSGRFDVGNAISVDQIKELPPEEIAQRILSLPQVSRMRGA